jgi:hypothetical protein
MNRTYRVPPLFRGHSIFVLILTIAVDVFLLAAGLIGRSGISLGPVLLFVGFSAPLLLGMPLYLLYHNSGEVVLVDDAVIVRRWGREKRLRYDQVVAVREFDWNLPPNLVLQGTDASVGINTQVERFSQVYEQLVQRVGVLRRRAEAGFPFRLEATVRYQAWLIVGIILFLAMYLGFGLLPIWSELVNEAPEFSPVLLRNATIWFALLSFVFVPALYIVIVGTIAGSLRGVQPVAYSFTEEMVGYRLPLGPWRSRPVEQLVGIYLKPVEATVRTSGKGVVVRETFRHNELALCFSDGHIFGISLDRIRQFGFTPNELYARLRRLYPEVPGGELAEEQIVWRPLKDGAEPAVPLPYTLRLRPLAFWNSLAATCFFALCTVGSVLLHLWLIASYDPGASANRIFWMSMALWGSVFLGLTVLTLSLTFRPRQPYKLVLTAEAIRFRYLLSPWRSWPVGELQEIELRRKTVRGVRSQGGRYVPKTISKPEVVLRFSEGCVLSISVERARQFGLTPPMLYALLQSLYGEKVPL